MKAVDAGPEPRPRPGRRPGRRAGTATAATHRCLWGALAAAVAWPALSMCGVTHAEAAAVAVGLLTVLPWLGPLLGIALAGVLAGMVPQPYAPLFGLAAAALVALAAGPAHHLPGWLGPLSIPAAAAAALLGGVGWGIYGALVALLAASTVAHLRQRPAR
ncbi:hypothetical protein [Dactylosporangium sp. CA-092794]|uniref:hypothetical protein n=1 Tax=Dactylosporangium sp. CA-092794 TaxID=3239929 RepID=UPI003D90806E